MKHIFFLFITNLIAIIVQAVEYPVSAIPEALRKDAKIVIRLDEKKITIKSPGRAVYYRHYVYTLMNEAAESYSVFYDYYDKFRDINSISGTLYDASGNKMRNVKKKDIIDESGNFGMHLAIDARLKIHSFFCKGYPYTIDYEVEVEMNGIFDFPDWIPVPDAEVAVESSKFTVETPDDYKLRYKQYLYNGSPLIANSRSGKIYTWEVKNVAPKKEEDYAPDWDDITTKVLIAPSDFEIAGYKGNMDSWQNFGIFMTSLSQGRDVLPDDVKLKVHQLADNLQSPKEKINALYKFLQDNTHYISIQLGLGGWQPLDANYVATKKYGDCKALSNYMVALLKEAGINGYAALIRGGSGESEVISDFPSNQFNHVIVCVPQAKDSVWLECTSQTVSPGYMGSFTGNRYALLINNDKSTLVHTPGYAKAQNLQLRNIEASVDETGQLKASVITTRTGLQQDELHGIINNYTNEEQQKRLRNIFSLPSYDVLSFSYKTGTYTNVPSIEETLQIISNNYASVSGKRMFVAPNVLSLYTNKIDDEEKRENDIVYDYPFTDKDTVTIKVPAGYTIEATPKAVTLSNKFGSYNISYSYKNATIQMFRTYERNRGHFPASSYGDYAAFYNAIYKADRAKFVLVKNE